MRFRSRQRAARWLVLVLLSPIVRGDEVPLRDVQRWRGFNLTDMTRRDSVAPPAFQESDFRYIAAWGFNFVRLPLTYEYWVDPQDWSKVVPDALAPIDDAIAWGRKYGLHVCLNFHRAPGYCINPPAEPKSLWTDREAQRVCAAHWAFFARRYRDVPSSVLSFNLLNEPPYGLPETNYQHVVQLLTSAIRREDPERLIIVDGLDAGRRPLASLPAAGMLQATRGYDPVGLTHFRADWAPGNDRPPAWPPAAANTYLHGPWKPDLFHPLELDGPFPPGKLRLTVAVVADFASLHVLLDGVLVRDEDFIAAKGGGVSPPVYLAAWDIHQTTYNRAINVPIPAGTRTVRIEVANGDWLTLGGVEFVDRHGQRALLALDGDWGRPQPRVRFANMTLQPEPEAAEALLRRWFVEPWRAVVDTGPVLVGEWGAYNKTPHEVTLRWMEDCLKVWQGQGWGWALWNLRGPFGVLDSGRSDVDYTPFDGHDLDAQMLELLRRY